ncbi:MAG TPA: nucleotidyl transferase AbiEii/AbiGii toxin family protein, partial [Anaeromyxobacteraceae bacterium]|nr:nucleotidyl transferase AbiEii/AbiGii toxin family protein [Anaeromyxobacteraceae bacterium]
MFAELLARLARGLEAARLPYMVVGGQAVLLHGEPRLTRDVDVTLGAGLERLPDLLAALGAMALRPLVDPADFTHRTLVLPCDDPATGLRVDFILSFTPYEREAIARAKLVTVGGARVRFATAEDLVVHKVLAGRPRDLEDVRGILRKAPDLDASAVRTALRAIGDAVAEPLVDRLDALLA